MVLEEIALQKNLANEWMFCQRESALSRFHHFFAISEFPFLMWRFVRQRVLKFAFAWSADFASRYRCELWMHFYQGPVKLGLQLCRICGIVRCSDKSQLALVCSDVFIFLSSAAAEVVFALSWTHKLENIVIHSHSIEPSERGPWRNSWSVGLSDQCKLSTGLVIFCFFFNFDTFCFFLSRA